MHSLVLYQVDLKCVLIHVCEATGFRIPVFILERSEVAFDMLEKQKGDFEWAMKDNRVEPLCTQERVQQK
ncbi:hypothetical protein TNCV_763261 [Trichonephila clavipes]|nr:hypothetical protein TNCV_763261 [Trichonephila clavipes]